MKFLSVNLSKLAGIAFFALSITIFSSCAKLGVGGDSYTVNGVASGTQVVPSSASTATSSIAGTFNGTDNTLAATIKWSGLSGAPTAIHIHNGLPGKTGGMLFTLVNVPKVATDSLTFTAPCTESQEGAFKQGVFYYDIHTAAFPNGEVRGQIIPQ